MQQYDDALSARPFFYTPRLLIRTPTDQDIAAIVAVAGDWEVASQLSRIPHPFSENDARILLRDVLPAELLWVVVERRSGHIVGLTALGPPKGKTQLLELGCFIAREHWGRGIATEAAAVIVAYGLGLVGRHRIGANFFADNPASRRVLVKLGFTEVEHGECICVATGTPKPIVRMKLI